MRAQPVRGERGSGALSAIFGVSVFLTLLMFCSHVLLNLWLTSSIDAVAHDAASDVATSGAPDDALPAVEERAIERAREALGAYGERTTMEFDHTTPDRVVLHVTAPEIMLLPRALSDVAGLGGYDRRVVVHREEVAR